jgi:hypothetical protein
LAILGREVSDMKMVIALLALALTLTLLELGAGTGQAQAAQNFCKQRYNACLARCQGRPRCVKRCREQYRSCTYRWPYLGDLI